MKKFNWTGTCREVFSTTKIKNKEEAKKLHR